MAHAAAGGSAEAQYILAVIKLRSLLLMFRTSFLYLLYLMHASPHTHMSFEVLSRFPSQNFLSYLLWTLDGIFLNNTCVPTFAGGLSRRSRGRQSQHGTRCGLLRESSASATFSSCFCVRVRVRLGVVDELTMRDKWREDDMREKVWCSKSTVRILLLCFPLQHLASFS